MINHVIVSISSEGIIMFQINLTMPPHSMHQASKYEFKYSITNQFTCAKERENEVAFQYAQVRSIPINKEKKQYKKCLTVMSP